MAAPFASLDLGTNTFRLLIAGPPPPNPPGRGYRPLQFDRVITRAGGGYTDEEGISPQAEERALACLEGFAATMRKAGVTHYRAVATSVFRKAANAGQVVARIREKTGLDIEIISGEDEAELSAEGALSQVPVSGPALIFDIGGGSTEYIVWNKGLVYRESLDFGVVRLSEDIVRSDPVSTSDLRRLSAAVDGPVKSIAAKVAVHLPPGTFELIGTAGTVSTLGAIDLSLKTYDRDRINGHRLDRCFVADNFERFSILSREARLAIEGMEPGREDLIVPGCYIALRTLEFFDCQHILVSEGGLLEGVMSRLISESGFDRTEQAS